MGISEAIFFRWKQNYAGLGSSELRRLKQFEEENNELKRLVADLSLNRAMLQDVLAEKSDAWSSGRARPPRARDVRG